jgi:hypothetical protein
MGNHRSSTAAGVLALAVLSGCPTVDLGDTPSDIGLCNPPGGLTYFQNRVWPEFVQNPKSACTKSGGCHSETGGNALSFKTMPVDFAFNYRQTQIYLNCGTPLASELLTKPLAGQDPHGGADIFQMGDPQVTTFVDWFK